MIDSDEEEQEQEKEVSGLPPQTWHQATPVDDCFEIDDIYIDRDSSKVVDIKGKV